MREHVRTLTPTLSLSEGEGGHFDALSPGGGEEQGEGERTAFRRVIHAASREARKTAAGAMS